MGALRRRRLRRHELHQALEPCWNVVVPAAIRAHLAAREIDCDDVLRALEVPVLVTQGAADVVVLPAMAEHVLATCPTTEVSWYAGVGHVPHLEEPERFNRELAAFTRSVGAPGTSRTATSAQGLGAGQMVGARSPASRTRRTSIRAFRARAGITRRG